MKAILPGSGFLFRFVIASMTAFFVLFTLTLAISLVTGPGEGSGLTGEFVRAEPVVLWVYYFVQIVAGALTFVGSFFVLSKKKK